MSETGAAPSHERAEEALLGAILFDPVIIPEVMITVTPEMFTSIKRRNIFEAAMKLHNESKKVDMVTMGDKLEQMGAFGSIGYVMLTELFECTPSASNFPFYANIVRRNYFHNLIVNKSQEIQEAAKRGDAKLFAKIQESSKLFMDYSVMAKQMNTGLSKVVKLTKHRAHTAEDLVPFGHVRLDSWVGGPLKRELMIVGARPSNLKTTFISDRLDHWVIHCKQRVLVLSAEIPADMYLRKVICKLGEIDSAALRRHQLSRSQMEHFVYWCDRIQELFEGRLSILDSTDGVKDLANCEVAIRTFKPDIVVLDYIQHMNLGNPRHVRFEIGNILNTFKTLANELDFAPIVLSQIGRAAMSQSSAGVRPRLENLKESGEIEEKAETVFLLHYPYTITKGVEGKEDDQFRLEIELAKSKYGPIGVATLHYNPSHCKLTDLGTENFNADGTDISTQFMQEELG